jgi:arylsulfatase
MFRLNACASIPVLAVGALAYGDWFVDHAYLTYGAVAGTVEFLQTFTEFPPSQRAATFGIDQAVEKLKQGLGNQ